MRYLILPLILLLGSAWGYQFLGKRLDQPENPNRSYFNFTSQDQPLRMAYVYSKPNKPNGSTVLLFHGKNFNTDYWEQTIQFLNDKGYAVLAPDQLGFGESSQPQSYQFSFQQLAANTKMLADSLDITEMIVLGHSMGGMLATRFALMYPSRCLKLILENPIGLEDWKLSIPYTTVDEESQKELAITRDDMKDYWRKNYFHNSWQAAYDNLLDDYMAHLKGKNLQASRNRALATDMIFTQPVCYEFKNLTMPVALIVGQLDRTAIGRDRVADEVGKKLGNYPVLGRKTAGEIKNCQLLEIAGVGHIPHVENFNLFCDNLLLALKGAALPHYPAVSSRAAGTH